MQFSIHRQTFIRTLNRVLRAISSRTTIPILTHVKLTLTTDCLTLTGSNSDISIETRLSAADTDAELQITMPGSITLPASFFSNIVKRLPADTMAVKVDGLQAQITSGSASYKKNGQDSDNYPQLPEITDEKSCHLSAAQLTDIISQTGIAASTQESRPILTGIHLVLGDSHIKAVATDSHRLAQRIITLTGADDVIDMAIIVPAKSLKELNAMLEGQDRVALKLTDNHVVFDLGETTFYSRLLEGNYPETDRLIPTESTTTVTLPTYDLAGAIDRAALLSHESRNNVVQMTLHNGAAEISSISAEVGQVREALADAQVSGTELDISFNPDYVRDALRVMTADRVTLQLTSNLRPFTIMPENETDNRQLQLITPVRTF